MTPDELLLDLAVRVQVLERLQQATLLVALNESPNPLALVDRLRRYTDGAQRSDVFSVKMEETMAVLEELARDYRKT